MRDVPILLMNRRARVRAKKLLGIESNALDRVGRLVWQGLVGVKEFRMKGVQIPARPNNSITYAL